MKIQSGFGPQVQNTQKSQDLLAKINERLATGKAINRAADGPSTLAMAKELEKMTRGFKASDSNLADAMNALDIADGASAGVADMLQRQRELALQSRNGTLNADDRAAIQKEFEQIGAEIQRTAQSTQFNGQKLGDPNSGLGNGNAQIQDGARAGDQRSMPKIDLNVAPTGDIKTATGAADALKSIDEQMKNLGSTRAAIGASTNAMEFGRHNLQTQNERTTDALSRLEDLDMAKGLSDRASAQLLQMSSQQALKSFGEMSRNNLQALLG